MTSLPVRLRFALLLCVFAAFAVGPAAPAQSAQVPRSVLKTFFQSGDKPTQQQFASLIDSAVHIVDDRTLLGLKSYDPAQTYQVGDTIILRRLAVGDVVGLEAEGSAGLPPVLEFASWPPIDPNDPLHMDMTTDFAGQYGYLGILLRSATGEIHYGYLQLGMDPVGTPDPGIHVDYIVYESDPNTPITISNVPEPGTALLVGLGLAALSRRRRGESSPIRPFRRFR